MAKIYARMIKRGALEIDDVPARWREAVAALLAQEEA